MKGNESRDTTPDTIEIWNAKKATAIREGRFNITEFCLSCWEFHGHIVNGDSA